jgi:hypothetical protein
MIDLLPAVTVRRLPEREILNLDISSGIIWAKGG